MSLPAIDTSIPITEAVAPYLGKWGPYRLSRDAVSPISIRHYCEVAEDPNPVYWDEEFAATTRFGRVIAPPQALYTMTFGGSVWWQPEHVKEQTQRDAEALNKGGDHIEDGLVNRIVSAYGYTTGTAVANDSEFLAPFGPGDGRFKIRTMIPHVSDVKRTRVGEGVFVTMVDEISTEFGDGPVGRLSITLLFYDSSRPRE